MVKLAATVLAVVAAAVAGRETLRVGAGQVEALGSAKTPVACWKDTSTRGPAHVPKSCGKDLELSGLLCYPACLEGYSGVGPMCWETCKEGEHDAGVLCYEKNRTVHIKHTYGRGTGSVPSCGEDEDQDWSSLGFCFPKCPDDAAGIGPVCWDKCTGSFPAEGGPLCCSSDEVCHSELYNLTVNLPMHIAQAVLDGKSIRKEIKDIKVIVDDILGYELPLCHNT
ncbi:Hypothetical Protein FCC1311_099812 [Hondaea fermentalgiana]|uniref:Uncharacterized protein n=1 Tax=Hondaea fermentalgiana TaxID=2315210 RepID=A0A2R5GVF9_9STRA|nr:Hypothetical Protein FCC1311_099812 [Hondaea fermentalgiana]|eukprot:GBG33758.1 Hypothetical Protein FCC1311_099812 [Hondaea fermentalgiana]